MQEPGTDKDQSESLSSHADVHTVDGVTLDGGAVEFHGQEGVITGNVQEGGVVRSDTDVVVQGELEGTENRPCNIDVGGFLKVDKSVTHAKIRARRVIIRGDVSHSVVHSDEGVEIRGNLSETSLTVGNRTTDLQTLRQLRVEYHRFDQQLDELKVRIGLGSRRFVRDYPQVDLQMGHILMPMPRELRVDLRPFYQAVKERDVAAVDKALEEFYLRVMVGALTRANKHYVSRNPSRHKVFLKLVEDLRVHIITIRSADKLQDLAGAVQDKRNVLLKTMDGKVPYRLVVGGAVSQGVGVQIMKFEEPEEGGAAATEMNKTVSEAKVVELKKGLGLEITDVNGKTQVRPLLEGVLQNGFFSFQEKAIVWTPKEGLP
ncbi:MAG: hypothetical protein O2954_12785, partial [bacterium]|nr:hypothetical protein [bacterium]